MAAKNMLLTGTTCFHGIPLHDRDAHNMVRNKDQMNRSFPWQLDRFFFVLTASSPELYRH
jgi:hypothetical protein